MLSNRCTLKAVLGLSLAACLNLSAHAQFRLIDTDEAWQEKTAIKPPPLSNKALIPVEGHPGSELRFGVDPASIAIVDEQVVRYTVVMQGPSARTVVYEGIRCSTGEKRVYARQNGRATDWEMTQEGWYPLSHSASARYAQNMARDGVCVGASVNQSVKAIVRDLSSNQGPDQIYGP